MTRDPIPTTDVYGYLMGEGFVMVGQSFGNSEQLPKDVPTAHALPPREVWPGIEDDVKDLERLLR